MRNWVWNGEKWTSCYESSKASNRPSGWYWVARRIVDRDGVIVNEVPRPGFYFQPHDNWHFIVISGDDIPVRTVYSEDEIAIVGPGITQPTNLA